MGKRLITVIMVACTMLFCFTSCYTHGPRYGHGPRHGHAKVHKGKHGKKHGPRHHKKGKRKHRGGAGRDENLFPRRR